MAKEKHWFKFYPDKWMGDIELRTCTPMARALLIDLMSISFPEGIFDLKTSEEKKQFIRQIGYTPIKFERSLSELLNKKRVVFDETLQKFFIPKMRKDHEEYEKAQRNGKKGGNPNIKRVNPSLNPEIDIEVEVEEEVDRVNITPIQKFASQFQTKAVLTGANTAISIALLKSFIKERGEDQIPRFLTLCDKAQKKLTNDRLHKMGPEKLIKTVLQEMAEPEESSSIENIDHLFDDGGKK